MIQHNDIMNMLPGMNMGKLKGLKAGEIDESRIERIKAIIYSMTKKRVTPDMYALSTLIFVSILILLLVKLILIDFLMNIDFSIQYQKKI